MKLLNFLEELEKKQFFQDFLDENPSSFLTAGFFDINCQDISKSKFQLDFFIPGKNNIAITEVPFEAMRIQPEEIKDCKPLNNEIEIDLADVQDKVEELKEKNKIGHQTTKIIAVLREDKWDLTCMSNTLDLLRIKIDALTGECDKFEKVNMMDIMRIEKKKKD